MSNHSEAFVAFDSSKLRNAVAIADSGRTGEIRFLGEIENSTTATAKLVRKLAGKYERLTFCYEAGPTGYELYRQIKSLGQECIVVAPSLIPKKPGDRVKTNRRDAVSLAKLLRAGERVRHQRGSERMLRARPQPRGEQGEHQHAETRACARQAITNAGQRGAKRQHESRAKALGKEPRRNLKSRHGAGKQSAQEAELAVAEPEFLLPQRQQHVDQISKAVVERVRSACYRRKAMLISLGRERRRLSIEPLLLRDSHVVFSCKFSGGLRGDG